jgi:hypothetical protein
MHTKVVCQQTQIITTETDLSQDLLQIKLSGKQRYTMQ